MGHELPGQTKGLYPLGCLAFKHVPSVLRTKLDQHATPAVYLGLEPKTRAFLLGSLHELNLSTAVEVTFVENVFPFRKIKHRESPSSLLWGTENNLSEGDPRLGMFESSDTSGITKVLDRQALKTIGALPPAIDAAVDSKHEDDEETPTADPPSPPSSPPALRRSTRVSQPPSALKSYSQIPWQDYPTITPRSGGEALKSKSQLQCVGHRPGEHSQLTYVLHLS